jgi:hypothetical protein
MCSISHLQPTPSLLIGILESLSSARLFTPKKHRDNLSSSNTSKVHCMKIFICHAVRYLEAGRRDRQSRYPTGLRRAQTRNLSTYVARLLCWHGRHSGLISRSCHSCTTRGQLVCVNNRDTAHGYEDESCAPVVKRERGRPVIFRRGAEFGVSFPSARYLRGCALNPSGALSIARLLSWKPCRRPSTQVSSRWERSRTTTSSRA